MLLHKLFQRTFSVAKKFAPAPNWRQFSFHGRRCGAPGWSHFSRSVNKCVVHWCGRNDRIMCNPLCRPKPKTYYRCKSHPEERKYLPTGSMVRRFVNELRTILQDRTSLLLPPPARSRSGQGYGGASHQARKHRPMFMVDLAVPRDIEVEVAELDDVFLYTVDDLSHVVQEGMTVVKPRSPRPKPLLIPV